MSKTEVVFFFPAINPYWRDRFNALSEDGNVRFHCVFSSYVDPERSWTVDEMSLRFPHTFLKTRPLSPARAGELLQLWRSLRPERIFTFHHLPALWPVWFHRALGGHVALYALMTWDSWVQRSWLKEVLKALFFSSASSTLTPGPDSDEYLRRYGASNSFRLHHAVDWEGLRRADSAREQSQNLRLLYVGRLIPGKGVPFLLDLLEGVLSARKDIEVQIVGDGPLWNDVVEWSARHGSRVRVDSFIQADAIWEVYAANDLLLFPTLGDPYGLVVDEALAAGLPVVSSNRAGDIHWRLGHGRGVVLAPDDYDGWAEVIAAFADDRSLLQKGRQSALEYSRGHGTERWVRELRRWITATATRS